nr:uncharacterized protein LOC117275020 [Nicotiana tomentosiformis]
MTIVLVAAIRAGKRNAKDGKRVARLVKVSLHLLPASGASMALFDMAVLIKKMLDSVPVPYHEWLFRFSQFPVCATTLLLLKCGYLLQSYLMCLVDVEISSFGAPFSKRFFFSFRFYVLKKASLL